jgi:hypothetical protein
MLGGVYKNVKASTGQDGAGTELIPDSVKLLTDSAGKPAKGRNGGYVVAVVFKGTFGSYSDDHALAATGNTVYATLKTQVSELAAGTITLPWGIGGTGFGASVLATSDWDYAGRNGGMYWPYDDGWYVYGTYSQDYWQWDWNSGPLSGNVNPSWLSTSTWTPNGLSAFGVAGNGNNTLSILSTPTASLDVSVDPYNSSPYDPYIYRSYKAGDPSTVPLMDENKTGNFRIRLYNTFVDAMTGPTEAYFVLPQRNDATGKWATTAGGLLNVQAETNRGDIEVWYTTDQIVPGAPTTDIAAMRLLSWTQYTTGTLPSGITAMKFYSTTGLGSNDFYTATFEFTTPDVYGNTALDGYSSYRSDAV